MKFLKPILLLLAASALLAAAKYFHVQDLFKRALELIAGLGVWGPFLHPRGPGLCGCARRA